MEVLKIKELEDCFDGSFIKEALLDGRVSQELIYYLGKGAELHYYPTFARPFFKIYLAGKYTLKGVEGNDTIRLILYRGGIAQAENHFVSCIHTFKS